MLLLMAAVTVLFESPRGGDFALPVPPPGQGTLSFFHTASNSLPGVIAEFTPAYPARPADDFVLRLEQRPGDCVLLTLDRNLRLREAVASEATGTHFALTWSEISGVALYVNGRRAAALPGVFFGRAVAGLRLPMPSGEYKGVRLYSGALDASAVEQLARGETPLLPDLPPEPLLQKERHGWHPVSDVPRGHRVRVKNVAVKEARAGDRWWSALVDGRRDTVWPVASPTWRYRSEHYTITPAEEPFNLVRSTGNAALSIELGDGLNGVRQSGAELHYFNIRNPLLIDQVELTAMDGVIGDVALLRMEGLPASYQPQATGAGPAIRGVRVELPAVTTGDYVYFAVGDPLVLHSKLIEFDLRATATSMLVELEFEPVAAQTVPVYLASSAGPIQHKRITLLRGEAGEAPHWRAELERRRREQHSPTPVTTAWTEPPPPAPSIPRWAWQQVQLTARFRQFVDWWINHRQHEETGEFGNGVEADARFPAMLTSAALLDGKVERYRRAITLLYENLPPGPSRRAAAAAALVLDPGRPTLAEAVMHAPPPPQPDAPATPIDGLWRMLEERYSWLTEAEPLAPHFDIRALETIRLGPRRSIAWENTGGAVAAQVEAETATDMRIRVFNTSETARQVLLRLRRLAPGRWMLTPGERTIEVQYGTAVSLDLPSCETVPVVLRRVDPSPPAPRPDLAMEAGEIRALPGGGLEVPVHNIGEAASGPFRVWVEDGNGRLLAETKWNGLEHPADRRPRIALVRFADVEFRAGLRVLVSGPMDSRESNDQATIPAPRPPNASAGAPSK